MLTLNIIAEYISEVGRVGFLGTAPERTSYFFLVVDSGKLPNLQFADFYEVSGEFEIESVLDYQGKVVILFSHITTRSIMRPRRYLKSVAGKIGDELKRLDQLS